MTVMVNVAVGKPEFSRKTKMSKRKMPNIKCRKAIDENNNGGNIFIVLR
jgi:hypothetical protein